jgi:hypothetical protein
MGRGRFLQLLSMPLSPCCPSCPAGMSHRFSQLATIHTAFAQRMGARLPVLGISRPPMGSLSLRPGDSLTIPRMALSVGFIRFVSSTYATQATGFLTFAPVGLSPTEHASLRWTHIRCSPFLLGVPQLSEPGRALRVVMYLLAQACRLAREPGSLSGNRFITIGVCYCPSPLMRALARKASSWLGIAFRRFPYCPTAQSAAQGA